jgi:hypothetical protein
VIKRHAVKVISGTGGKDPRANDILLHNQSMTDKFQSFSVRLTLILPMWKKWWAPASTIKWRMGFNSVFKGLINPQ